MAVLFVAVTFRAYRTECLLGGEGADVVFAEEVGGAAIGGIAQPA